MPEAKCTGICPDCKGKMEFKIEEYWGCCICDVIWYWHKERFMYVGRVSIIKVLIDNMLTLAPEDFTALVGVE